MNERIRELMIQSSMVSEVVGNPNGLWTTKMSVKTAEKFAELIVRECGKVIVNGGYRNPALGEKHPLTPPEIAKMIEEHFGVEE